MSNTEEGNKSLTQDTLFIIFTSEYSNSQQDDYNNEDEAGATTIQSKQMKWIQLLVRGWARLFSKNASGF